MTAQCKAITRNGTSCINQAIDSSGYCRSHHPQASQRTSSGGDFEEQVLKTLRLLGYKVERNVNINGCQIDVYGEFRTGVITLRLMVECKDYRDASVGIEEISKFAGVLAVGRNTGVVDKGLFVTTNGYTPQAKINARSAGIELTTYRELSTQLVDFESYLDRLIADFETSTIANYYVDLSATEVEDYEGAEDDVFYRPIDHIVTKRLLNEDHNKLALLGNFGTGKSTFCRKYAHDLALLYKQDQTIRIPIVINLSDYDSKIHIQQLILNTLQFRYNINITYTICQELQRIGRFLLIFDGFDEMATRVDPETVRENIREINKVADISENKFIVTCRTHFFRDRVQAEVLTDFDILFIPEWGETELKEYLQKRFGAEWEEQLARISGTHNLPELAQTPLFLDMIVETLPKLGDQVKRHELYQVYTDNWIRDQSKRKGARLSADQRSQFVTELAIKLYIEDKLSCHHKEFIPIIQQRFEVDDAAQMDYFRSDVQTCTFLVRDRNGNYGFRHKSFMEFFVARNLAQEIRHSISKSLKMKLLPIEVRGFLVDFLSENPPADLLKSWLEDRDEQILYDNALSLLSLLRVNIADTNLGVDTKKAQETKIVAQFLQGDANAFDVLFQQYRSHIYGYVRRRTADLDQVDDIVAEVFLYAWQHKERIERVDNFLKYILFATNNILRDRSRQHGLSISLDEVSDERLLSISDEGKQEQFFQREILMTAIMRLKPLEQTIIMGSYLDGKSLGQIASESGMKPQQVSIIRYRAIHKLREFLKDQEDILN